eukprot:2373669-Rhodomonas_salina.5
MSTRLQKQKQKFFCRIKDETTRPAYVLRHARGFSARLIGTRAVSAHLAVALAVRRGGQYDRA